MQSWAEGEAELQHNHNFSQYCGKLLNQASSGFPVQSFVIAHQPVIKGELLLVRKSNICSFFQSRAMPRQEHGCESSVANTPVVGVGVGGVGVAVVVVGALVLQADLGGRPQCLLQSSLKIKRYYSRDKQCYRVEEHPYSSCDIEFLRPGKGSYDQVL